MLGLKNGLVFMDKLGSKFIFSKVSKFRKWHRNLFFKIKPYYSMMIYIKLIFTKRTVIN